jgi:chaperonin GroES
MALHPLGNRVVVEPLEVEERSSGGIVLPDTAKEKPQQGKVLAVGPGTMLENGHRAKPDVKKGDTVLFAKYGGTEVKLGGKELKILQEDDILAKVEK